MTSLERSLAFIAGESVDRPPFHPIVMRFAARYAGVRYRDYCLDPAAHVEAAIRTADDFGMDWVTVMSDPYAEASAYGIPIDYPEDDLPRDRGPLYADATEFDALAVPTSLDDVRIAGRLEQIRRFRERVGGRLMIVGWVEGPFAMLAHFRGLSDACLDLYDEPARVNTAVQVAVEFAKRFAEAQIEAGADAIGMGDAVCSQISPEQYGEYFHHGEREIVEHVRSRGAVAKLHICGNTSKILPLMLRTTADIVDVDHLAGSMAPFAPSLRARQTLCGSSDPVTVVRNGTPEDVRASVARCRAEAGGRCIVSAGCEITPDTPPANLRAMCDAL